ncbi:glycosyltransferase family 4 protein [Cetobacterium sp.]|uniref:glycosyltransferase family 4 protein n=1 Tax=Cetobacterium sp. TaxID=2071632 RepID=UPI003F374E77
MQNKKIMLSANNAFVIYNFRYGLMKALEQEGYEIITLAGEDSVAEEIKNNGWKYINLDIDRRGKNIINDLKLFYSYYKIYKKEKPDYILQFTIKPNIYGTLAAKILGISVINNVTGLGDVFSKENLTSKIVKLLYKVAFKFPKKVFFQNDDDLEIFLKNKLIDRKICGRLPGSGVDIEKFKPLKKENSNEKFKFLFLGRISETKGVRLINEASKLLRDKYPNVEFQLLGKVYTEESSHVSKEELKEWEKHSNIKYLGTSKDVRNEIKECDCILFPSYYREGVPRSLIEAAAMAKLIITTNNVGCKDIVQDGYNGYLAEPKDLDSLIEKIEKVLSLGKEDIEKLGLNGRKKVEKEFDEKIVIQKYLEVIQK